MRICKRVYSDYLRPSLHYGSVYYRICASRFSAGLEEHPHCASGTPPSLAARRVGVVLCPVSEGQFRLFVIVGVGHVVRVGEDDTAVGVDEGEVRIRDCNVNRNGIICAEASLSVERYQIVEPNGWEAIPRWIGNRGDSRCGYWLRIRIAVAQERIASDDNRDQQQCDCNWPIPSGPLLPTAPSQRESGGYLLSLTLKHSLGTNPRQMLFVLPCDDYRSHIHPRLDYSPPPVCS